MKYCEADTKAVKKSLTQITFFGVSILPQRIQLIANFVATNIKTRVQDRGMGIKGPLKKYTTKYAEYKKGRGRQTSYRDLTLSGEMFNALNVSDASGILGSAGAKISFGTTDAMNKAKGNNAKTEFFGIGKEENEIVDRELSKVMSELKL